MSGGSSSSGDPTTADLGNGNGIVLAVPSSSASTSSAYGLTNGWGSQPIDLTGFPLAIMQALSKAGLDTSQPQPGDAIAAALAKIPDRAVVNQVQQMLFYGGFYSGVTNITDLQLGSFGSKDIDALKNLIQTGGQTGQPLGSYLTSAANTGMAMGTINQVAGVGVKPITIPADADIDAALRSSAEKLIGGDPSAQQMAGFRGLYDQLVVAASKQASALAAQSTANGLGDPNTLGAAAGRLGEPGYFGDAAEQPPAPGTLSTQAVPGTQADAFASGAHPLPVNGVPATQADAQEFSQEQAANAYQQQHAADQNTVNQFNQTANVNLANTTPTQTQAPSLSSAADQYLQQNDAGAVQAQDWAQKTNALYSILAGKGY